MSDIEKVKQLREATGAGFKDCNLIKETIENAKKASPSKTEEKPEGDAVKVDEKSTKTVQELDREKLDAKFSKKEKEKLN